MIKIAYINGLSFICRVLFVSIIPAILLTVVLDSFGNTLEHNGKWKATKTFLQKGVMGANDFYYSRNAIANGHLDLSCWHGYQEVVYKETLVPTEIAFDFLLFQNSYLVFEFNKNAYQFSGIRLSLDKRFKNIYFISSDEGEFTYVQGISVPRIDPGRWNRAKIIFGRDQVSFYLNEQFFGSIKISFLQEQGVGFRGGRNKVLIDNVTFREHGSPRVIKEDFDNRNFYRLSFILLLVLLFNSLVFKIFCIFLRNTPKQALFSLITGNSMLSILLISFLFIYDSFLSTRYFHAFKTQTLIEAERKYWAYPSESIRRQASKELVDACCKNDIGILFIGSSQTWGAGARNESATFVKRIEERLNSGTVLNRNFTCINAGVNGSNSSELLERYTQKQLVLEPQIVVIILSNNDHDPIQFSNNLRRFADLNISKGIKTIFVLEANSIEMNPGELQLHKIMREVGKEKGILVLDLHGCLLNNYDKGFLWWDFVHLSSFGQKLAADFLFQEISKELYSSALLNKLK